MDFIKNKTFKGLNNNKTEAVINLDNNISQVTWCNARSLVDVMVKLSHRLFRSYRPIYNLGVRKQ